MIRNFISAWVLLLLGFSVSAQGFMDTIGLLRYKGTATYVNTNMDANFIISFVADTIYNTGMRSEAGMAFMVDSTFVQVTKYKIPAEQIEDRFDARKEKLILDHFRNYELDYFQSEVFRSPLKNKSEFFENGWGKQFQLWQYEMPQRGGRSGNIDGPVQHQLFLAFVANASVIMVNLAVVGEASKDAAVKRLKEQIANDVRVYAASPKLEALQTQLVNHKLGQEQRFTDSIEGIQFTVPYWLNMTEGPYYLNGTFPDINNISNALMVMLADKNKYPSLEAFRDQFLENKRGHGTLQKLGKDKARFTQYLFTDKTNHGHFKSQYVYFESKKSYGVIIFTATVDTYDKNLARFKSFLKTVEIENF